MYLFGDIPKVSAVAHLWNSSYFWQTVHYIFRKKAKEWFTTLWLYLRFSWPYIEQESSDIQIHLEKRTVSWEHLLSSDPLIPRMKLNYPMTGTIWPQAHSARSTQCMDHTWEVIYVGRSAQRQNRVAQLEINLTNTPDNTSNATNAETHIHKYHKYT